jgi:hypothetical protein
MWVGISTVAHFVFLTGNSSLIKNSKREGNEDKLK